MKKNLIKALIFIFLVVAVLLKLIKLTVAPASEYRAYQWIAGFYEEPRDSLDTVMIGGSNVYAFYQPPLAFERYGITSWNFCSSIQPLELAEYMLREARSRQKDAVFVIFTNCIDTGMAYNQIHFVADYMPFSLNKLKMIHDFSEMGNYSLGERMEFYFPFLRFHSKWSTLEYGDFHYKFDGLKGGSNYKGFFDSYFDMQPYYRETDKTIEPYENLKNHFSSLLDYCDNNELKVIFVTSPQGIEDETIIAMINSLNNMARERGYPTLDMMQMTDELGIDTTREYYNAVHVNAHGSMKTTDYIAKRLVEEFGFSDKRGMDSYEDWTKAASDYHDILEHYVLDIEFDPGCRDYSIEIPEITGIEIYGRKAILNWKKVEGADGYVIYRRKADIIGGDEEEDADEDDIEYSYGKWKAVGTVDGDQLTFENGRLDEFQGYLYTVVPFARDGDRVRYGKFDYKGVYCEALMPAPKLLGISGEYNNVTINWKKVKNARGYIVSRHTPGGTWIDLADVGDDTSYTDRRMIEGQNYEYNVRAYKAGEQEGSMNNVPLLWNAS